MVINIGENIAKIREDMASAAKRSGRALSEIKLMGVTKYHPVEMMTAAASKYTPTRPMDMKEAGNTSGANRCLAARSARSF